MRRTSTVERLNLPPQLDGGVWRHEGPIRWRRRTHRHVELEWNLVTAGRASYLIDERRYDLTPGSSMWLFPEQDHVLINESADYAMWIVVLKPALLERVCVAGDTAEMRAARPASRFARALSEADTAYFAALCGQVAGAAEPVEHNLGLGWLAVSAWRAHGASDEATPRGDVHPAVERAARFIRDHADEADVPTIARKAGLSVSQLSRLFRRQTGLSLVEYRQRRQLERFRALFGRGRRYTMIEAALAAGFGSYSQFHRVFKAAHGFGPRELRRRVEDG